MTGERIKKLRKALKLSQEKFATKIGIQKNAISQIETGKNNLTEQNMKLICSAFNVNEEWLRTGKGEMIEETPSDTTEAFLKEINATDTERAFITNYLKLDADQRATFDTYIKNVMETLATPKEEPTTEPVVKEEKQPYIVELTPKEEAQLEQQAKDMVAGQIASGSLAAYNNEMGSLDEEARKELEASIADDLKLATKLAKEKFTPKKYRK